MHFDDWRLFRHSDALRIRRAFSLIVGFFDRIEQIFELLTAQIHHCDRIIIEHFNVLDRHDGQIDMQLLSVRITIVIVIFIEVAVIQCKVCTAILAVIAQNVFTGRAVIDDQLACTVVTVENLLRAAVIVLQIQLEAIDFCSTKNFWQYEPS